MAGSPEALFRDRISLFHISQPQTQEGQGNILIAFLKIFEPVVMQAVYDYLRWNTILGENPKKTWHELVFRTVKLTLDYPVTYYCMRRFGFAQHLIISFYIAKQCGLCDMIYIGIWKALHPGQDYTSEGIWWLWWTFPLGWIRTGWNIIINIIWNIAHHTYINFGSSTIYWENVRGKMTFKEFSIQLILGLAGTLIFYLYA